MVKPTATRRARLTRAIGARSLDRCTSRTVGAAAFESRGERPIYGKFQQAVRPRARGRSIDLALELFITGTFSQWPLCKALHNGHKRSSSKVCIRVVCPKQTQESCLLNGDAEHTTGGGSAACPDDALRLVVLVHGINDHLGQFFGAHGSRDANTHRHHDGSC